MTQQAITLAVLALTSSLSFGVNSQTLTEPQSSIGLQTIRIENLERALNAKLIEQFSPGLSVAVVANGKIILSKGFGKTQIGGSVAITPDTSFYIAERGQSDRLEFGREVFCEKAVSERKRA